MSKHIHSRILTLVVVVAVAALVALPGCSQRPAGQPQATQPQPGQSQPAQPGQSKEWPKSIVIASGPVGGPWYPTMVKCSEILMREIKGLTVNVIEGGAESNIKLVNAGKDAQIGMTSSAVLYPAIEGKSGEKASNITAIGAVLTSYAQFGVPENSSIKSIPDVVGKRVAPGKNGFISEVIFRNVLEAYGITYDDIKNKGGSISFVAWGEYPSLVKDNHIDMFSLCGEVPHATIMEIESSKPMRLLSIAPDKLQVILKKFPYLFAIEKPAGIYKGQKTPVTLLGYSGVLVANKSLPDDFLARVIEVLVKNRAEIVKELPFVDLLSWDKVMSGLEKSIMSPGALKVIEANR
ncbi:MAG: TAXI family TRAP transporter solute-binding subunit [Firmicutes bacterium]|nr:TAXI family TRAP transporter solute-binding subunit [Bacillota bacterium]